MRLLACTLVAVCLAAPGAAEAQTKRKTKKAQRGEASKKVPDLSGEYGVTFKELANTCTVGGVALSRGTFTFTQTGKKLKASFPMIPIMRGFVEKDASFKVRAKRGRTAIAGLDGEFDAAGKVENGSLDMVLSVQYFKDRRPFCQQSWKVTGPKKTGRATSALK